MERLKIPSLMNAVINYRYTEAVQRIELVFGMG